MKNILMIDLETTGTKAGCCILSIGAVGYDCNGKKVEFYRQINHGASLGLGFKDESSTMTWWNEQRKEVFFEAFGGEEFPAIVALDFSSFIGENFEPLKKGFEIWANGSDFDFPILNYFLENFECGNLWKFWTQRDYRTIAAYFPFIKEEEKNCEAHNALEDARAQLRGLEAFKIEFNLYAK